MQVKNSIKSSWDRVTKDPGVISGIIQIIAAITDQIVQTLDRRKKAKTS